MDVPALCPGISESAAALALTLQNHNDYELLFNAMLKQRKYMTQESNVKLAEKVVRANVNG